MHRVFPKWSAPILESVASIGLLFFLFLVGLELDLSSIRRSGSRAFGIAAAGITLPFVCGIGVAFVLRSTVAGEDQVGYGQFIVFMGVALSITAFPVLARILAELKLLTTRVGETAMAAAAFNDVAAWILLALAVALAGDGVPVVSVWVMLSGLGFVGFMMLAVRPAMRWVAGRCSSEHDAVDEAYICLTLAGVMASGFLTDLIGIHAIFGAFVFGLTIPKGGAFAERLMERIEDFVSGLLLPLYFASSGLKTDVASIRGGKSWGLLALVITTACAGKILGTFAVAMMYMIPAREALVLGLLMNTKGLVELIVLNIGKEKKVLNDETFAILVLMALFTTFITTPTVMLIYKPARHVRHPTPEARRPDRHQGIQRRAPDAGLPPRAGERAISNHPCRVHPQHQDLPAQALRHAPRRAHRALLLHHHGPAGPQERLPLLQPPPRRPVARQALGGLPGLQPAGPGQGPAHHRHLGPGHHARGHLPRGGDQARGRHHPPLPQAVLGRRVGRERGPRVARGQPAGPEARAVLGRAARGSRAGPGFPAQSQPAGLHCVFRWA
ncbi:unnamed protein product [Linum tenue]|uniref:Cation/H+ exchanger transmembrane domain-containing protein n=1 Tax=Linum tenue TaxID=586396 RepID=A0AAV0PR85_9ROSI|nr:unnamed protein product [Linum tenue]